MGLKNKVNIQTKKYLDWEWDFGRLKWIELSGHQVFAFAKDLGTGDWGNDATKSHNLICYPLFEQTF